MSATATRSKLMAMPRSSGYAARVSGHAGGAAGSKKEAGTDRSSRDQHRITVMLIIVVVVFLLCQLPQAIQHIYIIYHVVVGVKPTAYQKQVMRITGNIFNLLVMVNCAANFILYSAFSTKFRATFSSLFCACRNPPTTAPSCSPSCCCCCCCPAARTYTAGGDVTRNATVSTGYCALQRTSDRHGDERRGYHRGASTSGMEDSKNDGNVKEEEMESCLGFMAHTTTTDKLVMSTQSVLYDSNDDEFGITQL